MTTAPTISEGQTLTGAQFAEPMRVETVRANGPGTWEVGLVGTRSERFRRVSLTTEDVDSLKIADATLSYRGDGRLLRLALQAHTLGIAYELDRLRAGMLLQASGHASALRTLIAAEQERGPAFLRLANALSASYARGSQEKRLLDAMLLAVPR